MSDWERLYKKNKEIAKRFAGQLTEKAKDGLEQVKKGSVKNPMEIRNLRLREIQLEEAILNNRERLKAYKRLEQVNEYISKWDAEIHRSFYRDGGIRFYAERLMEHIESIDPETDTVEEMIVGCYNSAIIEMRTLFARLLENCEAWEEKIVAVEKMYSDDKALKRALGYEDCSRDIKDLYYNDNSSVDVVKELERLQGILERNEAAIIDYMEVCEARLKERPRTKAALLEDMKRLIGAEELDRFGENGVWTPETYVKAIEEYGKQVQEELLDRYSVI
ncbi:MAG: hypothetical protein II983_02450 [Firmicutes bacterium]|nr:hypothetical protein [Bacillota bacterium]MBQ6685710.1 hypothetical protein [Bacillota bacterium]